VNCVVSWGFVSVCCMKSADTTQWKTVKLIEQLEVRESSKFLFAKPCTTFITKNSSKYCAHTHHESA
jgi:hypothetical protein